MCAPRADCRLGWAGLLATLATAALPNCSDGEASTTIRGGRSGVGEAGPEAAGNSSGGSAGERDADPDTSVDVSDSSVDVADSSVDVAEPHRVLLFSKTTGFRHDSIAAAIRALEAKAAARRWQISATEDATWFDDTRLDGFDVVVFLMSTGDVLDERQQAAFERFIRKGRGWVGVHSASDTEYGWPWYGELVGAYFSAHPAIQPARLRVERPNQLPTRGLPAVWQRTDEWYSFSANPRSKVHVLISLDESSYAPAAIAMGDHPIAWYHAHDGGRAFYTALGHTTESWSEAAFLDHVAGGIEWAAGAETASSVLVEFDGVAPNGNWDVHQFPGSFSYQVSRDQLLMSDLGGENQHLTRRGIAVDSTRPYTIEGLFTLLGPAQGLDSFCFNLNLGGQDGDLSRVDTWSINVDALGGPPNGVMKHMGFVNGVFVQIGEHPAAWAQKNVEYLLRLDVNRGAAGDYRQKTVTATVFQAGIELQRFEVDYSGYPYQPDPARPVRIGANADGTDWALRGLRVYYTDN
jgi:type 1 glutamine amidotransferase